MSDDPLTEIKFWFIVINDMRQTVICPPDLESRIKGWVATRDMGGIITVHATPVCPPNKIILIDESALRPWEQA
jgi:hypothetical protein